MKYREFCVLAGLTRSLNDTRHVNPVCSCVMAPGGLGCSVSVDSGGESLRVGGVINSLANRNAQLAN